MLKILAIVYAATFGVADAEPIPVNVANQSGVEALEIEYNRFVGVNITNVDGEPGYPVKLESVVINKRMTDQCQFAFVENKGETLIASFEQLKFSGIGDDLIAVDLDLGDGATLRNLSRCTNRVIFVSVRVSGVWYDFKVQ